MGSIRNKNNWNNASKRLFRSYSHSGISGFHSGYSAPRSRIAGIYSGIHSYSGISGQTNAPLVYSIVQWTQRKCDRTFSYPEAEILLISKNHEVVKFHTNKNIIKNLEESCNPFRSSLISTSKVESTFKNLPPFLERLLSNVSELALSLSPSCKDFAGSLSLAESDSSSCSTRQRAR